MRIGTDGSIASANAEARRLLGLRDDDRTAHRFTGWAGAAIDEDGSPCPVAQHPVSKVLATGEDGGPRTLGVPRPGGGVAWVVLRAIPTYDAQGAVDGAVVTFLDITDRKRSEGAEESLRASEQKWRSLTASKRAEAELGWSEQRWRLLAESIPDIVAILDRDARLVSLNRTAPDGQSLLHRHAYAFLTEDSAKEYREAFEGVLASRTTARFESRSLGVGGSVGAWYETILVPVAEAEGGPVERVLAVARDVTDRKRNEEAMRASEQKWRTLVDALPDVVLVLDRDRRILSANIPGGGLPEYPVIGVVADSFIDETMIDFFHGRFARALETDSAVRYEIRSADGPGVARWYDAILVPLKTGSITDRVMLVTRDITSQRAMLATLTEKERLASVGMVAASVAHEIMNPLTYVLANLESALGQPQACAASWHGPLAEALEGAKRMQQIVWDLRSLGRAGNEELLYVDARSVLETALRLSGPEVARTASVALELDEVPGVLASESRLCQVFINLLINAAQAMEESPPEDREIRVRTRHDEASSLVAIEITDRGVGIPPFLHRRIFEPFFTTKRAGTGLGLSISCDIVARMGGRIELDSKPGRGTTFTVWLPTMRNNAAPARAD